MKEEVSRIENDLKFIWEIIYQFYKVRRINEIKNIVSKYGMDHEDVFQIASIAYLRAERKFNPDAGVNLYTFIGHCIKADLSKINQHFQLKKRDASKLNFISIDHQTSDGTELVELLLEKEARFEEVDTKLTINQVFDVLSKQERYLITQIYLQERPKVKVAKEIGITQLTIRKRIKKALIKMQEVVNS